MPASRAILRHRTLPTRRWTWTTPLAPSPNLVEIIDSNATVSRVRVTMPRKATEFAFNLTVTIAYNFNQNFVQCLFTEGYSNEITKKDTHLYLCPQNRKGTMIYIERTANELISLDLCEVEIFTTKKQTCRIPDNPENGYKVASFSSQGTYYVFTCSIGFELRGVEMIYCSSNGTWHPKLPTCVAITCLPAPAISNGYYNDVRKSKDHGYIYNDSVQYHCDAGYELIGDRTNQTFCVGVNRWSDSTVSCKEKTTFTLVSKTSASSKCKKFDSDVKNGNLIYVKDMVILQCNQGFEPLFHSNSTCVPSETGLYSWSPSPLFRCPTPTIRNGYYTAVKKSMDHGYIYNDSVQYHCDAGYELIGDRSNQIFCVGVNRWSGHPLYCFNYIYIVLYCLLGVSIPLIVIFVLLKCRKWRHRKLEPASFYAWCRTRH